MKNSDKRNIIMFFIISLITLTSSVFAWVSISKVTNIGGIESNIPDFTKIITFSVKRSTDSEHILINSIEDMHDVFGRTRPGETYEFLIEFDNQTSKDLTFSLIMNKIQTIYSPDYEDFDLRDLFLIEDGMVYIKEVGEVDIMHYLNNSGNYYLNDLVNENDTFTLLPQIILSANRKIEVSFTLVYDRDKLDVNYLDYQYNMLSILGIYVYGQ